MPLPARNVEWPPPSERAAAKLYERWGAWYSGDPDQLAQVYSDVPGLHLDDMPKGQPGAGARFTSMLTRVGRRMFWGGITSPGQLRSHRLHVPLAGDIASTSADLVYREPPKLEILEDEDDGLPAGKRRRKAPTQRILDAIAEESNLAAVLLEAGEVASAYGGAYLRVRWDPVLADVPLFDALPPDCAVPQWRGGRLVAVTLWRNLERIDDRHWRHLEHHEPGVIRHGVYVSSDPDKLGVRVRLEDHPETAPFALLVDAGPGDAEAIATGARGLTCEYVPNMRPNRELRGSPLGRSDYAGQEQMFDAFDEVWTSWMRDIRLAKGRLVVPRQYIQSRGRGQGGYFDADREIYSAIDGVVDGGDGSGLKMQLVQFAIRVEEHSRTCRELREEILRAAGYSAQTFGEADTVAATATEVVARQDKSFATREKKILYARGPVARIARTSLEVYVAKFGGGGDVRPVLPAVRWPDGVPNDPEGTARTLQMIAAAEAASIYTRVRLLNPDWEEAEVLEEVDRIRKDTAPPVVDGLDVPDGAPGGGGGGDDETRPTP